MGRDVMRRAALALVPLALLAVTAVARQTPPAPPPDPTVALDAYINAPEHVYRWDYEGVSYKTFRGGKAYALNVTSLTWLDPSRAGVVVSADGGEGDGPIVTNVWTHQVLVIVPEEVTSPHAICYLIHGENGWPGGPPDSTYPDVTVADELAQRSGAIAIVVQQIPNSPVLYPSDPDQVHRKEDAIIAWAWHEFLEDPTHNPTWLPRLPMAKAAFQVMRAAQEFVSINELGKIEGWFVAGASKRGWTTWMVGAANCHQPWCVEIVGIAPLVPISPSLIEEVHWMWRAYGGFTFAFEDYARVNLTEQLDGPAFAAAMEAVDPSAPHFAGRLARLPKMPMLASDDEFMMMDWTQLWYDKMNADGETHLCLLQNTEHYLITGLMMVVSNIVAMVRSIAAGHGPDQRPQFDYARDPTDGTLQVTVPEGAVQPERVVLRFAETLQDVRRDFRWVRQANNRTQPCDPPFIPLPSTVFGGNCVQPIIWAGEDLPPEKPGTWRVKPPQPREGFWMGYYIELYFPSDTDSEKNLFRTTTPGFVWPDTFPFEDCHGAECIGQLV